MTLVVEQPIAEGVGMRGRARLGGVSVLLDRLLGGMSLNRKLSIPINILLLAMGIVVVIGCLGVYRIWEVNEFVSGPLVQRVVLASAAKGCVEKGRVFGALAAIELDPDRRAFYQRASLDQFDLASEELSKLSTLLEDAAAAQKATTLAKTVVEYARNTLFIVVRAAAGDADLAAERTRALARIDVTDALQRLLEVTQADIETGRAKATSIRDMTILAVALGAIVALGVGWRMSVWMMRVHIEAPIARIREFLLGVGRVVDRNASPQRDVDAYLMRLLSRDIPMLDRRDEFGDITRAIDIARVQGISLLEDLSSTRENLIQQERMASLGRLVAGVAHEINTPLGVSITAASLVAEIAETAIDDGAAVPEPLDEFAIMQLGSAAKMIVTNLERAGRLLQSFKQVSAEQHYETVSAFELRAYVIAMIETLRPEASRLGRRVVLTDGASFDVRSRPDAIWQVFSNLVLNAALHAYDEGAVGVISVDVRTEGDQAIVTVSDQGKGIPPDIQAKIFEPFFTTRRNRGGAGLGLAIAYNMVADSLKGRLSCSSARGSGASFSFEFPIDPPCDEQATPAPGSGVADPTHPALRSLALASRAHRSAG